MGKKPKMGHNDLEVIEESPIDSGVAREEISNFITNNKELDGMQSLQLHEILNNL